MKYLIGKCYELISDGKSKKFRVIKKLPTNHLIIRDCETNKEEEYYTETAKGGFSEDCSLRQINCEKCDGKPSL